MTIVLHAVVEVTLNPLGVKPILVTTDHSEAFQTYFRERDRDPKRLFALLPPLSREAAATRDAPNVIALMGRVRTAIQNASIHENADNTRDEMMQAVTSVIDAYFEEPLTIGGGASLGQPCDCSFLKTKEGRFEVVSCTDEFCRIRAVLAAILYPSVKTP